VGLAIVRQAIERMGGRVGIAAHDGAGTRLWLELQKG
jgi:signal transduction histidine kinase